MVDRKVLCAVGARPNFMKIAPILRAFEALAPGLEVPLVDTGQHYDDAMNAAFFHDLRLPAPSESLGVGSGSHATQTAEVMRRFEPVLQAHDPDAVLVVGDVNSTLACALVTAKLGIPVVHVEAGLRSGDRSMPEEINRILTDQLADRLYVSEASGINHLLREGKAREQIVFVGNVMIDSLLWTLDRSVASGETLGASGPRSYGLVTLHRPSNVDHRASLEEVVEILRELSVDLPLVFPAHPRTSARLESFGLLSPLREAGVVLIGPVSYRRMVGLLRDARVVVTDSGGLQEESTALGVPCLTLRENTERPITVTRGTNTVVGRSRSLIREAWQRALSTGHDDTPGRPERWDGRAAERIVTDLLSWGPAETTATPGGLDR